MNHDHTKRQLVTYITNTDSDCTTIRGFYCDGVEIALRTIFLHFEDTDSHFNMKPGGTTTACNRSSPWNVFYACWSPGRGYTLSC
jgi:hypothetical protein